MPDARPVLLVLLFMQAWMAHADEVREIAGHIKSEDGTFQTVWIGIGFNKEPDEWTWTSVDSEEFSLKVPRSEEISLVALRKNSVPLVRKIEPSDGEAYVDLEFEIGHTVQATVKSSDGFKVENAALVLQPIGLPSVPIPEDAQTSWISDSSGRVSIGGLVAGEHTVYVTTSHLPVQEFSLSVGERGTGAQELVLDDAYFIAGIVVDQEGRPVAGAEIHATLPEDRRVPLLPIGVSSDDGSFALGPFPKSWRLHVVAREDQIRTSRGRSVFAGTHELELRLLDTTHVVGNVSDADTGEPLNDFVLWTTTPGYPDRLHRHIEAAGKLSAFVSPMTRDFIVDAPDHLAHFRLRVALEAGSEFDLGEILLQRGRTLTGRVFDAEDMEPIEGVEIALTGEPKKDQTYGFRENFMTGYLLSKVTARTNSEGEYSLSPVPRNQVVVHSNAKGYQYQGWQVRARQKTLDMPLRRWDPETTRITGRIESTTGEPVKGLLSKWNRDLRQGRTDCASDPDGTFDCPIGIGRYSVSASTKFGQSNAVNLNVKNGNSYEIRLIVEAKGRLLGRVDGLLHQEYADLAITAGEGEEIRNAWQVENGEFSIEGIGEGEFTLTATTNLHRQLTRTFEVRGEDGTADISLVFEGSSRLHGRIIESSWGSNIYLEIRAQPKRSQSTSAAGLVNDDRTYEIHGLDDGSYTVEVWRFDNHGTYTTQTQEARKTIEISGDTKLDFQLSTLFVAGNVSLDGDLSKASIDLVREVEDGSPRHSASVRRNGEFRIAGVQSGTYMLWVVHPDFEPYKETLSVVTSVDGLQIQLAPRTEGNLVLAGTVDPVGSSAGAVVRLERRDDGHRIGSATVDETGAFHFDGLNAGEYFVMADHDDFLFFQTSTSLEDSRLDFKVPLRSKGTLFLEGTLEPAEASAGAAVSLLRSDGESHGDSFVDTTTTDRRGRFRFEELPPDDYSIWVFHEEFEFVEQFVTLKESRSEYKILLQSKESDQD